MTAKKRLDALEAQRQAFEAAHVRRSDLPGFLLAVLEAVQEEAGQAAFQRVAGRWAQAEGRGSGGFVMGSWCRRDPWAESLSLI